MSPPISPATRQVRAQRRYVLRVTDVHGNPYPLDASVARFAPDGEFEFPFAPQAIQYPDRARTALHALADGTMHADEQGAGVPNVQVSGTFAQGIHENSLGVKLDGREWQRALEALITSYFGIQLKAARTRTAPALLEWHDTYRDVHLIVTPQATPRGREDAANPLRESYDLMLTGLRRTTDTLKARTAVESLPALGYLCPFQLECELDGVAREAGCVNARTA